jgi:3-oxoacyl-[acyl-carrier-protein] synthase II
MSRLLEDDCVVVTGMGAVSALGTGLEAHRAALLAGRDGLRAVERFDTRRMSAHLAGTWPGWNGRVQPGAGSDPDGTAMNAALPLHEMALLAGREACLDARLPAGPGRGALVFGTCFGQAYAQFHAVADRVAAGLALEGPCITISTACSSSTNAIGLARDLVLQGRADFVVAGGADQLLREAFAGFSVLGVLSVDKCSPFSEPPGTTLGEGAGFVVVERASHAASRGARPWATVHGYGLSADGFHETTPDPTGAGMARAIKSALADAGWLSEPIDFVSAHATGTANNDRIEWAVIEHELGAHGAIPSVSGSKSQIGHAQGAAGVLELILALLCHRESTVPPTMHFRGPRAGCPADPNAGDRPRAHVMKRALKLSSAFGGANAALAYGMPETPVVAPVRSSASRVLVSGFGEAGPRSDVNLGRIGVDPRRLDRSARWLTAAAALALGDGGRPLRGEAMGRTGLFVGATRMPEESARKCHEAFRQHGPAGISASAFARMSVNAPAGACSRALGLLGPTTTLSVGEGSGLLAMVLAAEWLAWRDDADRIVAGAVDERPSLADRDESQGARCLVLERAAPAPGRDSSVVAAGWGIAGRGDATEAVRQALGGRSVAEGVAVLDEPFTPEAAEASGCCLNVARAIAELRGGRLRSCVVTSTRGASAIALFLEALERS